MRLPPLSHLPQALRAGVGKLREVRVRAGPPARLRPFGTEPSARISGDYGGCLGWPPGDDSAHARAGTWQFYSLRAGSPPGAAFSRLVEGSGPEGWTAPGLSTGNCPTKSGERHRPHRARNPTAGLNAVVPKECEHQNTVSSSGAATSLLRDRRAFVV